MNNTSGLKFLKFKIDFLSILNYFGVSE